MAQKVSTQPEVPNSVKISKKGGFHIKPFDHSQKGRSGLKIFTNERNQSLDVPYDHFG